MATLSVLNPTMADVAKRLDPDGNVAQVVELLSETNPILDDMTVLEGNLPTGHRTTVRTGLPGVTWRKLYGGVQPSKSTTAQITDNCGMLEAYAEVDAKLLELNGGNPGWRLSEERAFMEAMNQEMAGTLMYGNEGTDPAEFTGLSPRYNDSTAESGENILNGGGSGNDNTSVWLVIWGPNTVHGIYPKGSQAGLSQKDLGEDTKVESDGGMFQVYRTHYKWECGLTVRDWRYVVRVANIDVSELKKDASSNSADLIDLMSRALELPPSLSMGRAAFYCNRTVKSFLNRQAVAKTVSSTLTYDGVGGKAGRPELSFNGIPVRRVDQITNAEAAITFA